MIEELFTVQQYRAALAEREATIEQLRRELDTALHNATYMTAEVAEIDTERLTLLDELAAARTILIELRDIADAPGEDIRATIDAYFAKEHTDDL